MVPIIPSNEVDKASIEKMLSGAFIATHRDPEDNVVVDMFDGKFKVVLGIDQKIILLVAMFRAKGRSTALSEAVNEFNAQFNYVKAFTRTMGAMEVITYEAYVQAGDGLYPPHLVRMLRAMEEIVVKTKNPLDPFLA